jgi:hypothetical protein
MCIKRTGSQSASSPCPVIFSSGSGNAPTNTNNAEARSKEVGEFWRQENPKRRKK